MIETMLLLVVGLLILLSLQVCRLENLIIQLARDEANRRVTEAISEWRDHPERSEAP